MLSCGTLPVNLCLGYQQKSIFCVSRTTDGHTLYVLAKVDHPDQWGLAAAETQLPGFRARRLLRARLISPCPNSILINGQCDVRRPLRLAFSAAGLSRPVAVPEISSVPPHRHG